MCSFKVGKEDFTGKLSPTPSHIVNVSFEHRMCILEKCFSLWYYSHSLESLNSFTKITLLDHIDMLITLSLVCLLGGQQHTGFYKTQCKKCLIAIKFQQFFWENYTVCFFPGHRLIVGFGFEGTFNLIYFLIFVACD